jgi:hypothetical protein
VRIQAKPLNLSRISPGEKEVSLEFFAIIQTMTRAWAEKERGRERSNIFE